MKCRFFFEKYCNENKISPLIEYEHGTGENIC